MFIMFQHVLVNDLHKQISKYMLYQFLRAIALIHHVPSCANGRSLGTDL